MSSRHLHFSVVPQIVINLPASPVQAWSTKAMVGWEATDVEVGIANAGFDSCPTLMGVGRRVVVWAFGCQHLWKPGIS